MNNISIEDESSVTFVMQDGKHLIFQLDKRNYGIHILTISEIIGIMSVIPIPKTPDFVKGIINLRGKIIPIIDLRLKFGMQEKEYNEETCIIIVNVDSENTTNQIGLVVDIVSEVVDIPLSEVEPPPKYSVDSNQEFITGVAKVKDQVVLLLNIKQVIYSKEFMSLFNN